jgi:hypothetical protein
VVGLVVVPPPSAELLFCVRLRESAAKNGREVTEERQQEILEKMKELNNYNSDYAKVLVMKSPEDMRRNPGASNPNKPESSKNLPANA